MQLFGFLSWIVRWIHVVDFPRPLAMKLNDGLFRCPREMFHLWRKKAESSHRHGRSGGLGELQTEKTYGVLLAFAFLLGFPMFMLLIFMLLMFLLPMFMFAGMLAFALFVFAVPVLALAGVAAMFALPAVFELSAVAQPAKRTVAVSKSTKAMVRRIEVRRIEVLRCA